MKPVQWVDIIKNEVWIKTDTKVKMLITGLMWSQWSVWQWRETHWWASLHFLHFQTVCSERQRPRPLWERLLRSWSHHDAFKQMEEYRAGELLSFHGNSNPANKCTAGKSARLAVWSERPHQEAFKQLLPIYYARSCHATALHALVEGAGLVPGLTWFQTLSFLKSRSDLTTALSYYSLTYETDLSISTLRGEINTFITCPPWKWWYTVNRVML